MSENRTSGKTLKDEMPSEDEDFLELNDEALPEETDDDDIILLLDESSSEVEIDTPDDDILELTDETPVSGVNGLGVPDSSPEEDEDFPASSTGPVPSDDHDADMQDILFLLEDEKADSGNAFAPEEKSPPVRARDLLENGFKLGDDLDAAIDQDGLSDTEMSGPAGMTLEYEPGENTAEALPVSDAQLAAAIERVIERKLGDKIEHLLFTAIEKAVANEIRQLKRLLADGSPESE